MRRLRAWLAGLWWGFRAWVREHAVILLLTVLILTAIIVYMAPDIVVTIGSGESGVLWKRFDGGTVTVANNGRPFAGRIAADRDGDPTHLIENVEEHEDHLQDRGYEVWPYGEGLHLKFPWDRIFIYNIRLQQISHTYDVLTRDGLDVKAEVTIRWRPIEEDLGKLHRDVGPDYVNTLLIPLVGAFTRNEIAKHSPEALYSPTRLQIQEAIRNNTKAALVHRFHPENRRESYLMVEDVLIRSVVLPPEVQDAIQAKVVQKHIAESYVYRLEAERREADRKAIEADGIRRFQTTIDSAISEGLLKWKGIEATLELAKSNNAKVVVIGAGEDGLPIILGGLEGAQTVAAPRPAAPPAPASPIATPGATSASPVAAAAQTGPRAAAPARPGTTPP